MTMHYRITTAVEDEPISLAEARLHIKADPDNTAEDSLIGIWITAARELAEHYTGRALAPQTIETALDCFPLYEDDTIHLPMAPVASITSVIYIDTNGEAQTISASAYALSPFGESNRLAPTWGNYWPTPRDIPDAVKIVAVHGYTTAPKAVKSALLLMVAWMNEHRGDQMDPDDIQPPAAKALLNTIKSWAR
jgi:uncharacterized phiE125 gp8 family phage protein